MNTDVVVAAVRAIKDPIARAKAAGQLIADYQRDQAALSVIRREAVNELIITGGMTATEVAVMLDLTRSRVYQLRDER